MKVRTPHARRIIVFAAVLLFAAGRLLGQAYTFSRFSGTALGSNGAGVGGTSLVSGLAFGGDGSIFFSDVASRTVRRIDPAGHLSIFAGTAEGNVDGLGSAVRFSRPIVTRFDADGNLLIYDAGNGTLRQIAPNGLVTTLFRVNAPNPTGRVVVTTDAAGVIYVGDANTAGIKKITPAGTVSDVLPGTGFSFALVALAVDQAGNIYAALADYTIRRVAPDGTAVVWAGTSAVKGSTDGERSSALFNQPSSMVFDGPGNLYVSDLGNSTLRKISPLGVVTTVAGSVGSSGVADGIGGTARLNSALVLTLHPSGLIYMNERDAGSIRTFSPSSGAVTTVTSNLYAGDGSLATATFTFPLHLALDAAGTLFVADQESIRKISADGVIGTLFDLATNFAAGDHLQSIGGLTVDGAGGVYVADYLAHTICHVSASRAVTIVAGTSGLAGTANGVGTAAQFNFPFAVVRDAAGNFFVADYRNYAIRKIAPDGTVSLFAGLMGVAGSVDGSGTAARFQSPTALAIDSAGTLYVVDGPLIRRITSNGVVTTLALKAQPGSNESTTLGHPGDVAVDRNDNLFVGDSGTDTIRKITPAGIVSTIGGSGGPFTSYGTGSAASFAGPSGIAVDAAGNLYVTQNGSADYTITKGTPTNSAPTFTLTPPNLSVPPGGTVVLTAVATTAATYQWFRNGLAISGATTATYSIKGAATINAGSYTVVATNAVGPTTSTPANLAVLPSLNPGRFLNLSVIAPVSAAQVLTVGFVTGGAGTTGAQRLLIRGLGPALLPFGVSGYLPDPSLNVYRQSDNTVVASNDNWAGNAAVLAANAAFTGLPLNDGSSTDAATVVTLASSAYSVQVSGKTSGGGQTLAEVYDATAQYTASSPRLINLSTLHTVAVNGSLTIGFVIGGDTARTVLVRVSGPALASFGLTGFMPDPQLKLYQGSQLLYRSSSWGGDALIKSTAAAVGAFTIADATSHDSAVAITLPPGAFTVEATSTSGSPGSAIIEVYEVP